MSPTPFIENDLNQVVSYGFLKEVVLNCEIVKVRCFEIAKLMLLRFYFLRPPFFCTKYLIDAI